MKQLKMVFTGISAHLKSRIEDQNAIIALLFHVMLLHQYLKEKLYYRRAKSSLMTLFSHLVVILFVDLSATSDRPLLYARQSVNKK